MYIYIYIYIHTSPFISRLRKIAKSGCFLCYYSPSVYSHGTTWFPLEGYSRNFIFDDYSKICRENSSFITI